ncbi:MAG: class I SAM-dependent methyltransferase [Bradyrhizobium sp.]
MIEYIGDVSREDAALLRSIAERSSRILEFGCGASTQIFRAYGAGSVESVETDPAWIEKTHRNLRALGLDQPVTVHLYQTFEPAGQYDLIFVDGIDERRQEFALLTWPALTVGGAMCFHDTRRTKPHGPSPTSDVQNVCALIERHSPEIETVFVNRNNSNTTVVMKRAPLLYEDWMQTEDRTPAQMGIA